MREMCDLKSEKVTSYHICWFGIDDDGVFGIVGALVSIASSPLAGALIPDALLSFLLLNPCHIRISDDTA